ncbi:succinate dehydrogenase assembly factor 4, mitochondrial isoform X2 [Anolis carolinensis]|uniref:Succinate dehydrogenase assembly factor 4, mitochondrial n=1 Tax=Anolis carolinensis TaxID=28377 RepID=A0A803TG33_ANOCA|nr:PREDICTED: succinate dehydrogenase assembly factor 4, mitochondrial [Anolis carolinensis]|eukprot:XP_008117096.1 PREDICTED: succinate dehydrogenase assembly factor 4, mitochondrial [Anolis carolinensis]
MAWTGRPLRLRLARWSPLLARAGAARSVWLPRSVGSINFSTKEKAEPTNKPLKKPKLPVGRFDEAEESNIETEPLEKFPDGINPVTKEKGGPTGPEPTRYGDWERKGRCIDF